MPILAPVVAGFGRRRQRAGRHPEASHSSAKPAGTWVALESIEPQSCGCGPSTVFVGEESTGTVDGTPIAFWIVAFACNWREQREQARCHRRAVCGQRPD